MGTGTQGVHCPGGFWTQIIWAIPGSFGLTYRVTAEEGGNPVNINVDWHRYSANIPWFLQGSFQGHNDFPMSPWDGYVRIDVRPEVTADMFIQLVVAVS